MIFAQRPECPFAVLVIGFCGKLLFEPFHLLLAQGIKVVAVLLGDMEAVNNQTGCDVVMCGDILLNSIQVAFPHVGGEGMYGWAQPLRYLVQKGAHCRFFRSGRTAKIRTLPSFWRVVMMAA